MNRRVLGVPIISIVGVLGVVAQGFWPGSSRATRASGSTATEMAWFSIAVFLGGLVAHCVAKPVQRSRGADVDLSFKQVPQERAAKLGTHTVVVTPEEYQAMAADPARVDAVYHRLATERLERWIAFAEERLAGSGIRCHITGGNDDAPDILEPLVRHEGPMVVDCEGKRVEIDDDGHLMLSTGMSNPTPWDTPRELPDEELGRHLEEIVAGVTDFTRVIFNFHAPPKDSTLDTAAELDWSTDPPKVVTSGGTPVMYGAGSAAVRAAIQRHQPLLSLHGHIHESRGQTTIGRTVAVNPGSEYGEGLLRGAIVTLEGDTVRNVQLTSG